MISASRSSVCSKFHESRRGVLLHLERRGGDAAGVGRLARGEGHPGLARRRWTASGVVGMLAPSATRAAVATSASAARSSSSFWVAQGSATSHGTSQMRAARRTNSRRGARLGVVADPAALDLLDLLQQLEVDALLVDDVAGGVGAGDHRAAELVHLLDGVDGDVAGSGDDDALAVEGLAAGGAASRSTKKTAP